MIRPALEDARILSGNHTLIPVSMELFSDMKTPIEILRTIKSKYQKTFILESVENGEDWGRYTFLGFDPSMTIHAIDNTVTIQKEFEEEVKKGNPHNIFKKISEGYKSPRLPYMPPFTGGFVGYFAYEYTKNTEKSLSFRNPVSDDAYDFHLMLFKKIIAIDHYKQKIHLIVNIDVDNLEKNYIDAVVELKDMEKLITSKEEGFSVQSGLRSDFIPQFSKEEFINTVEKTKDYIARGEIFQCVLSNQFKAEYEGDLLNAYRVLRTTNPSSYMLYIQFDDMQIAGASPETLVSLKDGIVSTFPLAGTCRRAEDDDYTEKLINSLLQDEKELSEHDMLVDLGRNDLGRICRFGSVEVEKYRVIKRCSHVCHIESKVVGKIKDEYTAIDALGAVIPAGTLTGAPKKRAMEIIDELEKTKRGVYGGAIGYIDFSGNMDLCIGIRISVLKDGYVFVQAGAGVVAESVAEKEYNECLNKSKAMMNALKAAKEVR